MSDEKKKVKPILTTQETPVLTLQETQDQYNEQIMKSSPIGKEMYMDLIKSATGSVKNKHIPRLAFMTDPNNHETYAGIFKLKKDLLPGAVIKRLRVQNFLIAAILRGRGNHLSTFGHIRKDRFDIGLELQIKKEFKNFITPEQMPQIKQRMAKFMSLLINCGNTEGLREDEKMTLDDFLDISARNGLSFGWFHTEIVYDRDNLGNKKFNRFRPTDSGTIYKTVRKGEAAASVRKSSIKVLEQLVGHKVAGDFNLDFDNFEKEYAWVQAIDGIPQQAFTDQELLVCNLYPSSDVEHDGYPVSPLDTVITSVTSHMSIELYNKLYFQNGRAAKGMLVIQSENIDQPTLEDIKQQYNASINDVTNSFRTPIFGVDKEDTVTWVPTTSQKKDGEFEFLFDQTTRNILAAFGMSPDELPGFTYLSKGTNSQELSESSNEYKLTAARDIGIRPLVFKIQSFLNEKLFAVIDPELAQLCQIVLAGLDAETKEQESSQLKDDMATHYTYDEIMEKVEKPIVGESIGGNFPLNEQFRSVLDTYFKQNDVVGKFADSPAAILDPLLKYRRDAYFFQYLQLLKDGNPAAFSAWVSTRTDSMGILKMLLVDYINEEKEIN